MQQPLYGLIGGKLGHSYSKIIHEKIADYTYELLPLPTEAEARTFMEKRAFAAINVTIPYKQFVIPYCDVVDPKAQAIGAVNTIVNRDGKLYGYNTDYAGFAYLAGAHGVDFAGKTVLILGTGGTHSTVTAVCRDGGAKEILTASRTGKGDALLYSEAMHRPDVQIIVNTTPCGMFPNVGQCLIDPKAFPALEAVLDVVYNPFRTELLLRAEDCGVTAAGGFEMLVAQAVFAAEHFTGRQLDTATIIPAVSRELRHQLANVSIIGMPGCGKSTVGAALAKRLDKKFVDLDAEIERRTGHNIPFDLCPVRPGGLFGLVVAKGVVLGILQHIRQILLLYPVVGVAVGVFVVLPLYQRILAVKVLVLQLARDGSGAPGLHIRNGRVDGIVGAVGFGAGGHQNDCIRKRQTRLRQTHHVGGIHRRLSCRFPVGCGEDGLAPALGGRLCQQRRQHLDILRPGQAQQLFQRFVINLLHHRLLCGKDCLAPFHLCGADKALLPLLRRLFVPGGQPGSLLRRLRLIAGGDVCRLLPGLFQNGVRLRLGVGVQPPENGINSVHVRIPFLLGLTC